MIRFFRSNAWLVLLVATFVGVLFFLVDPAPPREATMATGVEGGAYYRFGERLARRLAQDGFELRLQPTNGSVENLELLRAEEGGVSIALVQSGLAEGKDDSVHLLGSLFYEPLWVFLRRDLEIDSLRELAGQRMAVGAEGSGTRAVALSVLEQHGVTGTSGTVLLDLSGNEAAAALIAGAADVAFFVGAPGSVYVDKLLREPGAHLYNLRRQSAFRAAFPRLTTLTIGEGQLDLAENIPEGDRGVLASVATIVVNERFHPGLAPLILNAAQSLLKSGGVLERPGEFPQDRPGDFPLTREAEHFHRYGLPFMMRYLPFWAASLIDRLIILVIPMLALLIPVFRAAPPFYRWRVRRRIFRWYKHLREVDQRIQSGSIAETVAADLKSLYQLQDEILRVQVPLSYTDELYELHLHIEWVIRRLERVKKEATDTPAKETSEA